MLNKAYRCRLTAKLLVFALFICQKPLIWSDCLMSIFMSACWVCSEYTVSLTSLIFSDGYLFWSQSLFCCASLLVALDLYWFCFGFVSCSFFFSSHVFCFYFCFLIWLKISCFIRFFLLTALRNFCGGIIPCTWFLLSFTEHMMFLFSNLISDSDKQTGKL